MLAVYCASAVLFFLSLLFTSRVTCEKHEYGRWMSILDDRDKQMRSRDGLVINVNQIHLTFPNGMFVEFLFPASSSFFKGQP